jgi:hypothetical protein
MSRAAALTMPLAAQPAAVTPITVVLVISNLEYGGAQRQIVELANNFDPARVEVHVCSLSSYRPLAISGSPACGSTSSRSAASTTSR